MTTYDHYDQAKQIAERIEREGFPEKAQNVRYAIENGKSGTEIFMQLRFYLSPLLDEERVDSFTKEKIGTLIEKINEALTR